MPPYSRNRPVKREFRLKPRAPSNHAVVGYLGIELVHLTGCAILEFAKLAVVLIAEIPIAKQGVRNERL